ncbi:MAG TPA: transglycosylase SLT domain-containing protein [Thermodesulfobacteriota bacterium]|nr:transglycosylase SLT domain-containing protein [Thermodesulfobacteriota bacterium]
MRLFNIHVVPYHSASDLHLKLKKRVMIHAILESVKIALIVGIGVFVFIANITPLAQKSTVPGSPAGMEEFFSYTKSADIDTRGVLHLTSMIRLITENQIPEAKMLRYAGLIFHASRKYGVNPLEIIAIIMAESNFKEDSINKETGDYGLGQINWQHWGKDYGLTPKDLLDPSINIFLTCHVYQFFGRDFGKYHRGNGIQCNAYIVNVQGILSTLNAFIELKKENIS